MNLSIKNIAIYLRVSTEKQDSNTSKKTQLSTIEKYIDDNKINVHSKFIYEDKDSASRRPRGLTIDDDKISSRPGLNELIADARLKKFDTIIVFSHDRLTRNVQESLLLKYLFTKLDIEIIYCRAGEKLNSENQKINDFFESLLNNLSQLESNLIASRVKLGNEYNIKHSYWAGGPPPYGYMLVKDHIDSKKSVLEIVYTEARIVKEIFTLYIRGYTPDKIAAVIKEKYQDNDDRKWTKNTIKSILSNKDYTGVIVWNKKGGVRNPVKHHNPIESKKIKDNIIISDAMWEEAQKVKALQIENAKYLSTSFLLKNYLTCSKCGKLMNCKNNGKSKSRVYYCLKEAGKWELSVNADLIENKVLQELGSLITSLLTVEDNLNKFYERYLNNFEVKKDLYLKQHSELMKLVSDNNHYLTECESELSTISSDLDPSDTDNYNKHIKFLEELAELNSYLQINKNILERKLSKIKEQVEKTVIDKDSFQRILLSKQNMLRFIEENAYDKSSYMRSLRILFYDFIDKIILSEDKTQIDIILK